MLIHLKLFPEPNVQTALLDTIRVANVAAIFVTQTAVAYRVFGHVSLARLCYRTLRERFGLPANLALSVIDMVTRRNLDTEYGPEAPILYSKRLYRAVNFHTLSIVTVKGRKRCNYTGCQYSALETCLKMGEAELRYEDGLWLNVSA